MATPEPTTFQDRQTTERVLAYQVPADLMFPPGPDLRRINSRPYEVWNGSGWQAVRAGDWVVIGGKTGATHSDVAFAAAFVAALAEAEPAAEAEAKP